MAYKETTYNKPEIGEKGYIARIVKEARKGIKLNQKQVDSEIGAFLGYTNKIESGLIPKSKQSKELLHNLIVLLALSKDDIDEHIKISKGKKVTFFEDDVGQEIKNMRLDMNMRRQDLAEKAGLTRRQIEDCEGNVFPKRLKDFKAVLNVLMPECPNEPLNAERKEKRLSLINVWKRDGGYCFDSINKISLVNYMKNMRLEAGVTLQEASDTSGVNAFKTEDKNLAPQRKPDNLVTVAVKAYDCTQGNLEGLKLVWMAKSLAHKKMHVSEENMHVIYELGDKFDVAVEKAKGTYFLSV